MPSSGAKACVTATSAEDVDLELAAQLVEAKKQKRAADADPRVVDEAEQRLTAEQATHVGGFGADRAFVRDVEDERLEVGPDLRFQALAVGTLPDAAEDAQPLTDQDAGGGLSDAGRRPGDDDTLLAHPHSSDP